MRCSIRRTTIFALLALVSSSGAGADTIQAIAPLVAMRVNATTSDEHDSFHGYISVGDPVGGYAQYYWGGSRCPGIVLDDAQREALQSGMGNPRILIEPRTKQGQIGLCVVAFTFVLRSDIGSLP